MTFLEDLTLAMLDRALPQLGAVWITKTSLDASTQITFTCNGIKYRFSVSDEVVVCVSHLGEPREGLVMLYLDVEFESTGQMVTFLHKRLVSLLS